MVRRRGRPPDAFFRIAPSTDFSENGWKMDRWRLRASSLGLTTAQLRNSPTGRRHYVAISVLRQLLAHPKCAAIEHDTGLHVRGASTTSTTEKHDVLADRGHRRQLRATSARRVSFVRRHRLPPFTLDLGDRLQASFLIFRRTAWRRTERRLVGLRPADLRTERRCVRAAALAGGTTGFRRFAVWKGLRARPTRR